MLTFQVLQRVGNHAREFVNSAITKLGFELSNVIEIASNDGYLLQFMQRRNTLFRSRTHPQNCRGC